MFLVDYAVASLYDIHKILNFPIIWIL